MSTLGSRLEDESRMVIKRVQSDYWASLHKHRNRVLSLSWAILVISTFISVLLVVSSAIVYNSTRIARIDMETKTRRRMAEIETRACVVYPKLCGSGSGDNKVKGGK